MLTLLPKGAQTKYLKLFLIEDFFHLPSVSQNLERPSCNAQGLGGNGFMKKTEVESIVALSF
jgi:hypothetical protein